ncbi:type 1 glutamine amidotransferase [Glycomyces tarimensis]
MTIALVIENDPALGLARAADWLAEAGMDFDVVRPHAGEAVPRSAGGHDALIALGGTRSWDWAEELTGLLECAVADSTPTFALGSSAQMLAAAFGGELERSEAPQGPRMLAKRDAAGRDPLFGPAPMTIDVICWRDKEIARLPEAAMLLAASPYGSQDVFRIGEWAWGVQPHFELAADRLAELGAFEDPALDKAREVDEHIVETWKPIMQRFARTVSGQRRALPVVDA